MAPVEMVALFLSIVITTFNYGFFSLAGFTCLTTLIGILVYRHVKKNPQPSTLHSEHLLTIFFILIFALFLFFPDGIYQTNMRATFVMRYLPLFLFPVIVTYLQPFSTLPQSTRRLRFIALFVCAVLLRLLMITASPNPRIDVFTMLQEAPLKLLSGQNPYMAIYSPVYDGVKPDYFTYWPAAFLLQLPFVIVHDPRILLILADISSALLIWYVAKKRHIGELLALIYLYRPNSLFIIEQSWLASLELFPLIFAWALSKWKSPGWICGVVMAVLTAIKPLYIVMSIYVWICSIQKKGYIVAYLSMLFLMVLPFVIWNPLAFKHDSIDFFTRTPSQMQGVPVYRSLNANTFYYALTGSDIPHAVSATILGFLFVISIYMIYSKRTIETVIDSSILFLFVFYLFNYFSFINYYYMLSGLLLYSFSQKQSV